MSEQHSTKLKELLLFLSILTLGLILRLLVHLKGTLSIDEICSWVFACRMPFAKMWDTALSDPSPPLYYAVLHFTIRFFGDSPEIMRLPSVFFGMLILPTTYWVMRQGTFSKTDGFFSMIIVSVSSMLIYYSQELRAYIMLAFLGILSIGLLLRAAKNPTLLNNLFYGMSVFILSYTHRYGLLLIAAEIICMICYKKWRLLTASLLVTIFIGLLLLSQIIDGTFVYSEALDRTSSLGAAIALINMLNVGTIYLPFITGAQPGPYVCYPRLSINLLISLMGFITFSHHFFYRRR